MKRFRIKVCGMTRPADARLAASLGADMIGLIFYRKSPRLVTLTAAKEIVEAIPPTVAPVGVFVDTSTDRILEIAEKLRLSFVQLHGGYSVAEELRIKREGFRTIRVVHVQTRSDLAKVHPERSDLILIDNRTETMVGGTGERFDWTIAVPKRISNLVLAGGLDADNVAEGIARFDPMVIDVNSGVESKPGIKSPTKLRHFFEVCNKLRYGN